MMRGSNPLRAEAMTASERRREVCLLLGLGLVRLRSRDSGLRETVRNAKQHAPTHPTTTER